MLFIYSKYWYLYLIVISIIIPAGIAQSYADKLAELKIQNYTAVVLLIYQCAAFLLVANKLRSDAGGGWQVQQRSEAESIILYSAIVIILCLVVIQVLRRGRGNTNKP